MEMSIDPIFMVILERQITKGDNYTIDDLLQSPLEDKPAKSIIFLILMVISSLMGLIGNSLVIGAVIVSKKLRTTGNYLIVNLAIADLIVVLIIEPFNVVGIVDGAGLFIRNVWMCHMVSVLCVTACVCSMMTLAAIAVNRYIMIIHYSSYSEIFTHRNTILICIGLWLFAVLIDLPNFIGMGRHTFDIKSYGCSFDRGAGLPYILFLSITALWIPLGLILFCYLKIYLKVRKSKKLTNTSTKQTKRTRRLAKQKTDSVNLARTFFIVFVSFLLCWTPFDLLLFVDMGDHLPSWVYLLFLQVGHFNSSLNSILYGATNKRFWDGYKLVLSQLVCIKSKVIENRLVVIDSTDGSLSDTRSSVGRKSLLATMSTSLSNLTSIKKHSVINQK